MLGTELSALAGPAYRSAFSLSPNLHLAPDDAAENGIRGVARTLDTGFEAGDQLLLTRDSIHRSETIKKTKNDPTETRPDDRELSAEEQEEIEKLKDRDQEVRRHEQAHFQAAGKFGSPPKYEFQTGPDGKRYAVGGSVDIDLSEVADDPQATLEKARIIKRAALAPEEPSAQDRKVAREADRMASEAQRELSETRTARPKNTTGQPDESAPADSVLKVSNDTEALASVEDFDSAEVSRYKTSRLEIGEVAVYTRERLAMPRQAVYAPGRFARVDLYV